VFKSLQRSDDEEVPGIKEDAVSTSSTRSLLYQLARLLGDVSAVQKHRVGKRIARRATGRMTGRALGRMFR